MLIIGTQPLTECASSSAVSGRSEFAYGVFTAAAVDHELPNNMDYFVFSNGTIRVHHSNPTGPQTFNPKTGLLTASLHGTYRILGGTGKYAGSAAMAPTTSASCPSGRAPVASARGASCLPPALHQVVSTSGPVSLP